MKRRKFIQIAGITGAGVIVSKPLFSLISKENIFDGSAFDPAIRYPNYCEVCFWNCAGWVYKKRRNSIWKVTGNTEDPHCNGRFCPRGTGGIGMYYDEDRLKKPMIRVEKNGKQSFEEVSWDTAFTFIANKLTAIKQEHGPETVALIKHGTSGRHFQKLIEAFGSKNISSPNYAQCKGPREEAFRLTFGKIVSSPEPLDIKNTKCLVNIGSHLGENMHNGQVQEMSMAIDNGATLITVDPRFSTVAGKSDYWLPIRPSTDLALLLAWINVIIELDGYDKEYIEKYTFGFDKLKEHVKDKTPEWASEITGIATDVIINTAKEMIKASPAVIINPGRHVTWYGDDTQRLRAIAILNAILGSYGRKGGFFQTTNAMVPGYPSPAFPEVNWTISDIFPGKYQLAEEGITNLVVDASHPNHTLEKKIRAWFVVGSNLPLALPNTKYTLEAIDNLDLLVVCDTMPTDITSYADVILPECTFLERWDELRVSKHREATIALRMPAVNPKYWSKPGWWIAKGIAAKLGLGSYFNYEDYKDVVEWQLGKIGISLAELKKKGLIKIPRNESELYFQQNQDVHFKTKTGKIELYSTALEENGFDPLPNYTVHPDPPKNFYRLNYGRAPMHTFSRTANNQNLSELMNENNLWVHPSIADEWKLFNGQEVWLKNQDGIMSSFSIKIRITERIHPSMVYMVHGFGHANSKLSRAHGKGINDNELITNIMLDPIMGGTGMRGNFVTFITKNPEQEAVKS